MRDHSQKLFAALALLFLAVSQVQAQPDPNLKPTYGAVALKAGFLPDPYQKDLLAGGQLKTNLGGVNAYVAKAPDFSLQYTKGNYPLTFTVKSVGDTTLLINLPDGTWIADDDSGGGLNPLIRIAKPASGRYDIYVGTFKKELLQATLSISEVDVAKQPPPPVNENLPDCHILSAGVDGYRNANKLSGCLNDARNTVAAFKAQTGKLFRKVEAQVLLDETATRGAILQRLQGFSKQGAPGDFMVLFLSGHGGRTNGNKTWFYLPVDFHPKNFAETALTDKQILDAGDTLVKQKKKVVIIVDACFCGQIYATAQPYLSRYTKEEGGMIFMLSSAAHQTSAALGNYSAFAKAFADAMTSKGDLNTDGKVTLSEIQVYSLKRTAQLLYESRIPNKQDSIVAWSKSISNETPLAATVKDAGEPTKRAPTGTPTRWAGMETLAGFGMLSFALYPDGRVIMVDAKNTSEGIWQRSGEQFTLSFFNGAVVYTGTLNGAVLSGTATSPSARTESNRSWTWTVRMQPG